MTVRIAINGFGRMGRLAARRVWEREGLELVLINDVAATPASAAHLLAFDSMQGKWHRDVAPGDADIQIDGQAVAFSNHGSIEPLELDGIDVAIECTGQFKSKRALEPYRSAGVAKVVVSAPVKDGTLNIVMGVNDHRYRPDHDHIVTAASCTTNCIAPAIKVMHETFGIRHGTLTTIHDITNTQSVLDQHHGDLRRARASGQSLIPTSTGSATAIAEIFPELAGKLNGIAVRVPVANASITDLVLELETPTSQAAVNTALEAASRGELKGIMGFETRPLVSIDYLGDTRSCTVDHGRRRDQRETLALVRQRTRLRPPDDRTGRTGRRNRLMHQALAITVSYWFFTVTDGALRMLVVLHFANLGMGPLELASLFLFYEFFGAVTNLVGGALAARLGLAATLVGGIVLQIVALGMLLADATWLTVAYVMVAQALSGIAKDLNKLAAKSSAKSFTERDDQLYRWVSFLTGSKNALKGAGFFVGGLLLNTIGFTAAIASMAALLVIVLLANLVVLNWHVGRSSFKPKFRDVISPSKRVNYLSAARFFLFGSRDVWFVIALPVFLQTVLGWSSFEVGTFFGVWIIGYGIVQSAAPWLTRERKGRMPTHRSAALWGATLAALPALITFAPDSDAPQIWLVTGLMVFGVLFAINSAIHSYLIVAYAKHDGVTLDIGFYYMANAAGRLTGTILSGSVYQLAGLEACLWVSTAFVLASAAAASKIPGTDEASSTIRDSSLPNR